MNFQITTEERQVFNQIIKDAEKAKLDITYQEERIHLPDDPFLNEPFLKMLNGKFYQKEHLEKSWKILNDYDDYDDDDGVLFLNFYKGEEYLGYIKWDNRQKGEEVISDWSITLEDYLPCLKWDN